MEIKSFSSVEGSKRLEEGGRERWVHQKTDVWSFIRWSYL